MGEKRNWNDDFNVTSMRRKRDLSHKFCDDVFYTQGITNGLGAEIDNQPVKADRYGYYHGKRL